MVNKRIPRTCEVCRSNFFSISCRVEKGYARFCSRGCYNQRPLVDRVARVCQQCGRNFETPSYNLKYGRGKFCDRTCRNAHASSPLEERFWAKVTKTETCWVWNRARDKDGYGQISGRRAHAVSYELAYGNVPDGICVLHHCDNPPCVRPDHLFLGTVGDNNRDRAEKGRSNNGHAELTPDQVREIRARYTAGGITLRELAEIYHKHRIHIHKIIKRKYWKHID